MSSEAANNTCYSFAEAGSCRFGDRCRFSHGAGHPGVAREPREARERAPRGPRAPREPREHNSAPRDNSCYSFAQSGSCKFGDACRFTHGDAAAGAASSARPRRARTSAPKSQLCFSFSESQTCQYGDACRFGHGDNDQRDLGMLKRRAAGICYNFKESGECKFGESCRFEHAAEGAKAE